MAVQGVSGLDGVLAPSHCLPPRLRTRDINSRHALRVEFCVLELRPTHVSGCRRPGRTHARKLVAPQCVLIRTEAGWPGSLNRFPVSVISVPLTFRMEISWSRELPTNRYFPSVVNAAPSGRPPNP